MRLKRNWRALLGLAAGLLLPLPLLLLLGGVMFPALRGQDPHGARVSPVLDVEERTRRVTFHRRCRSSSECEAPLGCLFDRRVGAFYCTDSQCTVDEQCPEDLRCRELTTLEGGPLVRFCVTVGVRQEGERCNDLPPEKESACRPELLCAGREGWCARPCRPSETADCPEGFFCAQVLPRPVCLPTCEARGCPEGQQCVRFEEGASACAVVYGPQCQQSPCPHSRECEAFAVPERPGKVWMECIERCGKGHPPCTAGLVCDGVRCEPPCDPEAPPTCAAGYRCRQYGPDEPWLCRPDF